MSRHRRRRLRRVRRSRWVLNPLVTEMAGERWYIRGWHLGATVAQRARAEREIASMFVAGPLVVTGPVYACRVSL